MARQVITGGDGTTGQTGEQVKNILNENFVELYPNVTSFTTTLTFTKPQQDMYTDQAGVITIDADLTGALHGSQKILFINGDNTNTLSFTNKFEKLIGSLDFDNTKFNHIICEYNANAVKVFYRVAHSNRLTVDATAPTIVSALMASNNAYIDVNISEGVYTNSNGTGALTTADLTRTFTQNSGTATNAVILSVKKNDSAIEASASALTGGESVIRVFLTVTGSASGVEFISITPASGAAIYDVSGNAMLAAQTTGNLTLNAVDTTAPSISSAQMGSNNAYIDVVFSEGIYTNVGLSPVVSADFTFNFSQNAGTATGATVSSVTNTSGGALTGGETTVRFNLSITGTPNGAETCSIIPANGTSVNDIAGNMMGAGQTTGNISFNNSSYSADATTMFALMPDELSVSLKNATAIFIDSQVASGNWALIREFQFYAMNTQVNTYKGWKGIYNASSSPTAITWNAGSNFQPNGISMYLNTGYTPSADATVTQNNVVVGCLVKEWNVADANQKALFGAVSSSNSLVLLSGNTTNTLVRGLNNNVSNAAADTYTGEGTFAAGHLYEIVRIDSSNTQLYKQGSQIDTDAKASAGRPAQPMYIGARNNTGTADLHASCKVIAWFVANSIGFNHADFETNLQTLKTAVGA